MFVFLRRGALCCACVAMVGVLVLCIIEVSGRPSTEAGEEEDFSRYLADDSLVGTEVPCTHAEKQCLRFNRLLHAKSGRCYPMGHGPRDCRFFVDRREFIQGKGHVRGVCLSKKPCEGRGDFLMASDGRCVGFHEMIKICSSKRGLEPTSGFFGGSECLLADFSAPAPKYTPQPEEAGRCVFPNLRHDFTSVQTVEAKLLGLECEAEQRECFSKGLVWLEERGECFPLLERGPCPEGHHLVLQTPTRPHRPGRKSVAASTCAPVNPCGVATERPLAFEGGKCYDAALIRMVLCPTGVLLPNAFGHSSCSGVKNMYKHVIVLHAGREGACAVEHRVSHALEGPGRKVVPDCSLTDAGTCSRAVDDLTRSVNIYNGRNFNDVLR